MTMNTPLHSSFTMLRTIEAFLRTTGMAPTRFGREAVRDPRIVLDMRNGREPSQCMCRRLNNYITAYLATHEGSTT